MRILISTFGSLGDIHPYMALALEARRRGHEAIIATSPRYRTKIESEGLQFRPVRPEMPAKSEFEAVATMVMDAKKGPEYLFNNFLIPSLRDNYVDLLEAGVDADIIITHPAALGGPLAARKLEKKWLSSVLAPTSLWSIFDPSVPPTMPHLDKFRVFGPIWGFIMARYGRHITRSWVAAVDELSRDEGLPTGHAIFEGQFSPHGTLALFSPHFGPPQWDWPTNTVATGFCFFDKSGYREDNTESTGPLEPNWRRWIADGEKPVVATLGSSAAFVAGDFWQRCRESTLNRAEPDQVQLEYRGLYVTGGAQIVTLEDRIANSPYYDRDHELFLNYAPYSQLFPQALCIVHQGGIGTTAQALRAGVPQIVVPFSQDQPDNAARIQRLGVGLNGRGMDLFPFEELITNCGERAAAMGEKIRRENGPLAACKAMERLTAAAEA